jgi:galactokinase
MRRKAVSIFEQGFGTSPTVVVRAPGRVNLLGGHTDYNEGYVLPAAIDRAAWLAAGPRDDGYAHIVAWDMKASRTFRLDDIPPADGEWADYPRGVAWALSEADLPLVGMNAVLTSDVPVGAGLSSSAAVEVAFAKAWQALSGFELEKTQMALLCQRAESEYVGLRCGVMDQMASVWGRREHAFVLDCRSLEVDLVPIPTEATIVVVDTGVRRELASSEYNRRREECEQAVEILSSKLPHIASLRDVCYDDLLQHREYLPGLLYKRARHVVTDNARVLEAAEALRASDLYAIGAAMRECHKSLRDDYEVSSPELNLLAEVAWDVSGCYGARLTGAGFGGCVVALGHKEAVDSLSRQVEQAYVDRFGSAPAVTVCRTTNGVNIEWLQ